MNIRLLVTFSDTPYFDVLETKTMLSSILLSMETMTDLHGDGMMMKKKEELSATRIVAIMLATIG